MEFMATTLRLELTDGSWDEEYRIENGVVETRKLHRPGDGPDDTPWRRVSHEELSAHVRANTIVAQWLKRRLGWRRLLQACTDPQTLQEFGISENSLDRFAA